MKGFFKDGPLHRWLPWATASLLVLLASILAVFQYRWLDQVAQADRERTHSALDTAVRRFAADFNEELMRLLVAMRGGRLVRHEADLPSALLEALEEWREGAVDPDMVGAVWILSADEALRLDEASASLGPVPLDPGLGPLQQQVEAVLENPRSFFRHGAFARDEAHDRARRSARDSTDGDESSGHDPSRHSERRLHRSDLDVLSAEVPALVLPLFFPSDTRHEAVETHGPGRRRSRRGGPHLNAFLVLQLDRQALRAGLLTDLAERHFGRSLPFHLIVQAVDQTPDEPIFEWDGSGAGEPSKRVRTDRPEAQAELFGPLIESQGASSRLRRLFSRSDPLHEPLTRGRWMLTAFHPEGSLDRALERAKRRNMAVALGILMVLGAALVMLTHNVSRSRTLARKQIGFVAGITHELMTPVAALRSAGQNLADGLVDEPSQVRRYGRMIDLEGRRLGDLVGQVLAFARMQTERPRFRAEDLRPEELVAAARDEVESRLVAEGIELELDLEDPLPEVRSDRQAAQRSLVNLLGNAIKYGRPAEGPHRIVLRCRPAGAFVDFEVEDFGPGISATDRRQIFEPFFRGADHAAGAVPGSGLGLALVKYWVETQGGRVEVRSKVGDGAVLTVRLPVVASSSGPGSD